MGVWVRGEREGGDIIQAFRKQRDNLRSLAEARELLLLLRAGCKALPRTEPAGRAQGQLFTST